MGILLALSIHLLLNSLNLNITYTRFWFFLNCKLGRIYLYSFNTKYFINITSHKISLSAWHDLWWCIGLIQSTVCLGKGFDIHFKLKNTWKESQRTGCYKFHVLSIMFGQFTNTAANTSPNIVFHKNWICRGANRYKWRNPKISPRLSLSLSEFRRVLSDIDTKT